MKPSIPVLYYHRVGAPDKSHLSISVTDFARQMEYLSKKNINVISASDLFAWLNGAKKVDLPAVCITFDDGFIDNFRHAHPILQKTGFKAALFMATSLIRPESCSAAAKLVSFNQSHTLARRGDLSHFLAKSELQEMVESGVWEVYSHTHFHNQVFTSEQITGVFPDSDEHWGILSAYGKGLETGRWPVFKRNAGLMQPAYRFNCSSQSSVTPSSPNNVSLVKESDSEFTSRVKADLQVSLNTINSLFPSQPPLVCWPWGCADKRLEDLARQVGYQGAFRTDTGANYPGMDLMQIRRFPVKKGDLFRFSMGLWLRRNKLMADLYARLRNLGL